MSVITRIEPKKVRLIEKKKVAAYARISMETEQLKHSLSAQISHYSELIQSNPEWEYVGVYADDGITGRNTKGRKEFKRLIADCEEGKVDLILVKSISRFARDTVDTLRITRRLKTLGIDVFFERESIHSLSDEGELMLTLLASFAQQESVSIGENVKWGIRKGFKDGKPNGHKPPFGYRWNGEKYVVIPEQAEIVKAVFNRYLAGESAHSIMHTLEKRGIVGQKGIPIDETTIKFMVTNYSYAGVMVLQKNYINDEKKRRINHGELPMYVIEDMYEPIVSKEDVVRAIEIRQERAENMPNKNPVLTKYSGKMKCGYCGCSVSRRTRHNGNKVWACNTKERKGKSMCNLKHIYERELNEATKNISSFERITVFDDKLELLLKGRKVIWERK